MENVFRQRLAWIVFFVWITSTAIAFWQFEFRDLRTFTPTAESNFRTAEFNSSIPAPRAIVVHIWNPECRCNRFNEQHVKKIISQYRARNIEFITATSEKWITDENQAYAHSAFGTSLYAIEKLFPESEENSQWLSPTAAILNGDRQVVYTGPYSNAAYCSQNDRYIEQELENLVTGKKIERNAKMAFGCYCPMT